MATRNIFGPPDPPTGGAERLAKQVEKPAASGAPQTPDSSLLTHHSIIVVESEADLGQIDFDRPIYFLAQTTGSLATFRKLAAQIEQKATHPPIIKDTICRQVADREHSIANFARKHDVVIFVAGAKSSNGQVLFEAVKAANPRSHKIESARELRPEWLADAATVGVCGATSTPRWAMEEVSEKLKTKNSAAQKTSSTPTASKPR